MKQVKQNQEQSNKPVNNNVWKIYWRKNLMRIEKSIIKKSPPLRKPEQGIERKRKKEDWSLLWRGLVVSKLLWGWEVWSQQRETIHAWWSILEKHFVWTWSWQFASFAKPPWLISFMQRALCVFLFLFKVKESSRETLDGGVCETTKSNPTL